MTRQQRTAIANYESYKRSTMENLFCAYKTPSYEKAKAWRYCENLMEKFGGYGLKVIHKNTWIFSAGFKFTDAETGKENFMYITPNYDTAVEIAQAG